MSLLHKICSNIFNSVNIQLFHHFQINVGGVMHQTQIGQFLVSVCNLRLTDHTFVCNIKTHQHRLVGLCLWNDRLQSRKALKFYVWFWENNVGVGS